MIKFLLLFGCFISFISFSKNDDNSAPTDILIDGEENFTVPENIALGHNFGNLITVDIDEEDNHVYSFVNGEGDDDNDLFVISEGNLLTNQILNYETATSYSFRLQTDDQDGGLFEKAFVITVTDVDEEPIVENQVFTIAENTPVGLTTLFVEASDPEGDEITYSSQFMSEFLDFDISSDGFLILTEELNASESSQQILEIEVTDNVNTSFANITINIENINDIPTNIVLDTTAIGENNGLNEFVASISTEDRDINDQFLYSLVEGDGATDNGSFLISENSLLTNEIFDFETKTNYSIRIKTDDQNGGVLEKAFAVTINDVNEEPIAQNQSFSVAENVSTGLTSLFVEASDPEGNDLTYSAGVILDEENAFDISSDGELILTEELNASIKSSHRLEVDVTDGSNTSIFEIEVFIENINDVPTNIALDTTVIGENNRLSEFVTSISTEDRDLNDQFLYSLVEGEGATENGSFLISENSLLANEIFDFETKTNYSIRIKTDDQNGGIFEKAFNIDIVNINDITITSEITQPICIDDETGAIAVEISEFIEPLTFEWSNGETTQNLENIATGNYTLTITDGADMSVSESFDITNVPVYNQTSVCYISAQDTSNLIYVNKGSSPFNVNSYLLYREGSAAGVYDFVGEMSSEQDFFVDSLINNRSKSFSYRVSMKDECGVETSQSNEHSTIHLSVNKGLNDEVNLIWTPYDGLEISTYSIYRKTDNADFILLDQVSSNNNSFTDFTTSVESNYFYYVSIAVDDACNTDQNRIEETVQARSNTITIENIVLDLPNESVSIYPNPVDNFLQVETLQINQLLQIIGTDGRTVIQTTLTSKKQEVDLSFLSEGIYIVKILNNTNLKQVKIYKN